ncbi:MFS transporter [Biostraticola tofi]|uniref:DHA1 family purine ribonucleoside efflux pump-like MFS transporter n=1 Tax=Biostraticola tofi TaxID=466109 RepID=A0A4R3Z0H2_9GAMM|nr:MFS transporter [Biostraticola tofi]TCV99102.1 DHA1 family purine ribonucleoside efflux pump-like MFS transporter [Biostraticola tofi]
MPLTTELDTRTMPRERAAWPAVYSLALGAFVLVTAELLPIGLLTPMANDLEVSNGAIGQTITAVGIAAALAGPLLILAAGRVNRRLILWTLMGALVVSSILTGLSTDMVILLSARALLGFAIGGFWAMLTMLAIRLVPSQLVPRAMAIILMGISAGITVAPSIGAFLGSLLGWRETFFLSAALGLVTLVIQFFTLPSLPATSTSAIEKFAKVIARPSVLLGIATVLIGMSGHIAAFTFIRPFLEISPVLQVSTISLALLVFGIGGLIGNMVSSKIAEHSPAIAIASSSALVALSILVLAIAGTHPTLALIATAIWGCAYGGFPVATTIWNARAAAEADLAEPAGALHSTAFQVAIACGGILGGLLIDGVGLTGLFIYSSITMAIGAVIMFSLGRSFERREVAASE